MKMACLCGFDWGIFWNAISAVATAIAAVVALYVPHRMDRIARQRAKAQMWKAKQDDATEICKAIETTFDLYFELRQLFRSRADNNQDLRRVSIQAINVNHVLALLLRRPGLSDGLVTAGVAAEWLASSVGKKAEQATVGSPAIASAQLALDYDHGIAVAAYARTLKVIAHYRITGGEVDIAKFEGRFKATHSLAR